MHSHASPEFKKSRVNDIQCQKEAGVALRRLVGGAARKSYSPPGGRRTQWGDRACSAPTLFPKDQKGCKIKPLAL
jgi:hypothetical protein